MSKVVLGWMGHRGPGIGGCPRLSCMGILDLGLVMPIDHAGDNLGCPRLYWDRWDILDLELVMLCHDHPGMSKVVLTGHNYVIVMPIDVGTTLTFDGNPR